MRWMIFAGLVLLCMPAPSKAAVVCDARGCVERNPYERGMYPRAVRPPVHDYDYRYHGYHYPRPRCMYVAGARVCH